MANIQAKNNPTVLGTENIRKLLLQYSIPAIVAMLASSIYNIVDRIFIGQGVGALAISGLALTFPLMNVSAAFGSLVGAGGATLVSIKMGQKDHWGATEVLGNVVMLNVVIGLVIMIVGLIFLDPVLYFFGASDDTIVYAREYMQIVLAGNVITHLYFGLNNVMRASGYPQKAMVTTLLAVVVNAVLDPIFIFALGWGIRGAAVATVLAQVIALIWVTLHFTNKNNFIHFQNGIFKIKKRIAGAIFAIGMSPFALNLCACLVVILINQALKRHGGDLAIGAYGIVNSITMMFPMIVMGFNQGMQPIAGYNFGAKQYARVTEVLRYTIIYATCVTTLAFAAGELFPRQLAMMFTSDATLLDITVPAMRIVLAVFPIVGFQMVAGNFFQSIGKAKKAMFLSTTRQLLFLVPLTLTLPNFWGITGVWMTMPISDFLSSFIAFIMLRQQFINFKKQDKKLIIND